MTDINKDIIKEDLEIIADYIYGMACQHPEILTDDPNFVKKIDRRINDILNRIEG